MSAPIAQDSNVQTSVPLEDTVGVASQAAKIQKPFVGLVPLDEDSSKLLAGREEEVLVLTSNLRAARLTMVYGASGVGKSSLLRAGVVASLREKAELELHDFGMPSFAVAIMSTWSGDPFIQMAESVRDGIKKALDVETVPPMLLSTYPSRPSPEGASAATDLVETLRGWTNCHGLELLIILDQFEEYFLYHANEDGPGTFVYEFPQVLAAADMRVRFLMSMRDDSLYKLDLMQHRIPSLFENRLQVKALTLANARDAIHKAIAAYNEHQPSTAPVVIEESLVDKVLEQVRSDNLIPGFAGISSRVGPSITEPISLANPLEVYIDAPYMQLVMSRLWDEESAGWKNNPTTRSMRLQTLTRLGGAQAVIDQHLDQVMRNFTREERRIARDCFYRMVTPSGTKYALTPEELEAWTNHAADPIRSFLEKLAGNKYRIVRRVDKVVKNSIQAAYEAHHDRLASAMLAWQALQRDRQIRNRNRFILFGAALFLAGLVFYSIRTANKQGAIQGAESEKVKLEKEFAIAEEDDPRLEKFAALKTLVPKFTCVKTSTELSSDAQKINSALEIDCSQYEPIRTAPPDAPIAARIYIHIQNQEQRPAAEELRSWLKAARFEGNPRRVIVAGIEYVGPRKLRDSQIRFFHQTVDETDWAWQISKALTGICIETRPQFIKGYEESDSIRPRHFELWLTPDALDSRCISTTPAPAQ